MGIVETLYDDSDHIEHWDHPKPAPGMPCAAGTQHLHTYGLNYTLGRRFALLPAMHLSQARLAELLDLATENVACAWTASILDSSPVGFSLRLAADSRYGPARVTYGPARVWTVCSAEHPASAYWFEGCKCAVDLPRGPVASVLQAAADMIRRNTS